MLLPWTGLSTEAVRGLQWLGAWAGPHQGLSQTLSPRLPVLSCVVVTPVGKERPCGPSEGVAPLGALHEEGLWTPRIQGAPVSLPLHPMETRGSEDLELKQQ